jgi:hypothetical protein
MIIRRCVRILPPRPFLQEALTIAKFEPGVYEVVRTFTPAGDAELKRLRFCPLCADCVEKVESWMAPKISRMSNVCDLQRSKALQNRCERRWSLLRWLMWSLTSQRVRPTRGSENFWSYAKKDFFNSIRQQRPFHIAHSANRCASGVCNRRKANKIVDLNSGGALARPFVLSKIALLGADS